MTDVVHVPHPDNMDDETFQKHMNYRHQNSLSGLAELNVTSTYVLLCYRKFHRRLHDLYRGQHDHREYKPDS